MIGAALRIAGEFIATPIGRRLAVLASGLAVVLALVAGVVALRAHWIGLGVDQERAAQAERIARARATVAKVEAKSATITDKVAGDLVQTKTEIRWRTRVQIQEVTRYVPEESDHACVVGAGAVQLRDHAFAGLPGLPQAAGGPVDADSGVALSALVGEDVAFAGVAYEWKAEAIAWRDWYVRQSDLWTSDIKTDTPP